MTLGRVVGIVLAAWFVLLIILLQPHAHAPPTLSHTHLLAPTDGPLATIRP